MDQSSQNWKQTLLKPRFKIIMGLLSVLLIVAFLYQRNLDPVFNDSIIRPDQKVEILVDEHSQIYELIQRELSKETPGDSILEIIFIDKNSARKTEVEFVKILEMFSESGEVPSGLKNSLIKEYLFGIYSHPDSIDKDPFMLVRTNSFVEANRGMRDWESTMYQDLSDIFAYQHQSSLNGDFHNTTIRNQSVRVLTDMGGEYLLLYSFIDENMILLSTNSATFRRILDIFNVSRLR